MDSESRSVGIIANPASGKDIRRLVAHASVFDNAEKTSIIRRVIVGAYMAGARRIHFLTDAHQLVETALESLRLEGLCCEAVETPQTGSALDTAYAAAAMRDAGCAVVVTLGGDGTNRAAAKGWLEAPLLPISTGTNNVFPRMLEGTVAGMAAGLVAAGRVPFDLVARVAKCVHVEIEDEQPDLALVDAVLVRGRFVGARALWDARGLETALLTRAEPAAVGIAAIGGLLQPLSVDEDAGLLIRFGAPGRSLLAPIAPGLFQPVPVACFERVAFGQGIELIGPGVLALDGEREREIKPGRRVRLAVRRDGPRVVDVEATLQEAARRGVFLGAATAVQ